MNGFGKFSTLLCYAILGLPGKGLEDVISFQLPLLAT
jgi:hypothetical protein